MYKLTDEDLLRARQDVAWNRYASQIRGMLGGGATSLARMVLRVFDLEDDPGVDPRELVDERHRMIVEAGDRLVAPHRIPTPWQRVRTGARLAFVRNLLADKLAAEE